MHLYTGKVLHAGSSLFWDHDIFKPLLQPLLLPPADEKFPAHLTHPSKNWVAVIWLLVINHDQPFSIYCIPSCAGDSQFVLQDGTQRNFRSIVQWCLVWKKNPNPNISPCTSCGMFKGASLPPAQNRIPRSATRSSQKSEDTSVSQCCTTLSSGCMDLPDLHPGSPLQPARNSVPLGFAWERDISLPRGR